MYCTRQILYFLFVVTILSFEITLGKEIAEKLDVPLAHSRSGRHFLYAQKVSYNGAIYICEQNDAKLVSIDDEIEDLDVTALLVGQSSSGAWTSGKRLTGKIYVWESTGVLVPYPPTELYNNWEANDPTNSSGIDCILDAPEDAEQGYKWQEKPCSEKHHVVCEYVNPS